MAIGLVVAIFRFINGIGAVSNLSDGRAWGLWISFDLFCGVALAAGGFTLAATVYIFRLKKYYPIVRAAILTAFLGYLMVIVALLVDLGQPWRIWHILIYWNPHSPLFEVGWCVLLYTAVLALEFSPSVFERFNMQAPLRLIRAIQIPLDSAGHRWRRPLHATPIVAGFRSPTNAGQDSPAVVHAHPAPPLLPVGGGGGAGYGHH
jgi:Ni/Fe-hydrogenase subunit HybB-like protein